MTHTNSLFDFVPGLPIQQLQEELALGNQLTDLGKRKTARYLFDMHARGVHMETGHSTAVHYARSRLGMTAPEANRLLLAGRRLDQLPLVDDALVADEISWSKMLLIQRVTEPETQREWLEFAQGLNCRQLEFEVKRSVKGELPKRHGDSGLTDLRMTIKASVRIVNHQMWEQARRKVSAEIGMTATNEDMMIQAARLILSTDAEGKAEGRSKVKHSPFQLIIHQDAHGTWVHTDQGDVKLDEEEAARLAAQAELVPMAAPVADPDGKAPARLVKRVLARDNHRCQNCGCTLHLQVHHVEWRVNGGKTEEDLLASLCTRCHSMIHQGLLCLHGNRRNGFVFLDRSGTAVEGRAMPCSVPAALHTALASPPDSGNTHRDDLLRKFLMVGARRSLASKWGLPLLGSNAHASNTRGSNIRGSVRSATAPSTARPADRPSCPSPRSVARPVNPLSTSRRGRSSPVRGWPCACRDCGSRRCYVP